MSNHTSLRRQFTKALTIVLTVALALSPIPPLGWSLLLGAGVAYAAPAARMNTVAVIGVEEPVRECVRSSQ